MSYVIFDRHPGDLLEMDKTGEVYFHIGNQFLKLISTVKLLQGFLFQVVFESPTPRHLRQSLIKELEQMQLDGDICEYHI